MIRDIQYLSSWVKCCIPRVIVPLRLWKINCCSYNVEFSDEQANEGDEGDEDVASDGVVVGPPALGEEVEAWKRDVG